MIASPQHVGSFRAQPSARDVIAIGAIVVRFSRSSFRGRVPSHLPTISPFGYVRRRNLLYVVELRGLALTLSRGLRVVGFFCFSSRTVRGFFSPSGCSLAVASCTV